MSEQQIYDPEVEELEADLLNYFAKLPVFRARKYQFMKILGYFISREMVTQEEIRSGTGLSLGTVSQEINKMLESGLIEKVEVSETGKFTYKARSVGSILLNLSISIIDRFTKWEPDLFKIKKEIEENHKRLELLEGFKEIDQFINHYLYPVIPIYKGIKENLEEKKKELEI